MKDIGGMGESVFATCMGLAQFFALKMMFSDFLK